MFFAIGPFESKTNIQTLSKFSQLANINSNKARNERIFNKKKESYLLTYTVIFIIKMYTFASHYKIN